MKRQVVIIGAGRSGRGMLGELFSLDGFHVVFADNDSALVAGLRKQGYYTVKMSNMRTGVAHESRITDFDILDTVADHDEYIKMMCNARLIATALLPEAFDQVIGDLVEMIRVQMSAGNDALQFITLGANYVGLYEYYDHGIRAALSPAEAAYYERCIRLVMSIVNRKNLLPGPEDETEDHYRIVGDDKAVLRVEESAELAELPILPSFFRLEKNLSAAMVVKIWSGNLVQCSMAFIALHAGLTRTYEASFHPIASKYAYYAAAEGYAGVAAQYGLPPRSETDAKQPVTVFRTKTVDDSLYRIVREPIRKLGKNDRFIGPALLAMQHGVLPYYICRSCAYAFLYRNEADPQSLTLQKMLKKDGIRATVYDVCGLDADVLSERTVAELIINAYLDISGVDPLTESIENCSEV